MLEKTKIDVNLDLDSKLNYSEYKSYLKETIGHILAHSFANNKRKQGVIEHHDRLSFACPICDDSASDHNKKRGNVILTGKYANYVKCFNCGYFSSVESFLKKYNVYVELNVINYIADTSTNFESIQKQYDPCILFDTKTISELAISRDELKAFFKLHEPTNTYAQTYLTNRLIYNTDKFLYDIQNNDLVILNITHDGKILGFQRRSFNKYAKQRYKTYKLSKIYQLMNKDHTLIPDDIDSLSNIFNVCIVDWTKPVTAFEGPIDSFLFGNSIAITGVHKHFNLDMNMRYLFDKDNAGVTKSIEMLENGYAVFMWGKLISDCCLPHRKKWDLNDLLIFSKQQNKKLPNLNKYFTSSTLDIIEL
ncbi:MAG: hypothetical protein ACRCTZ_20460 [Sarcina sp.]